MECIYDILGFGKCQNPFLPILEEIGKSQNWKEAELKVSESDRVRNWKVSESESVRIEKYQNWKLSELESVRMFRFF